MKIAIILILIMIFLFIVIYFTLNRRKDRHEHSVTDEKSGYALERAANNEFPIKFDMLPAEVTIDDNKLVEITDKEVLARIVDAIPEMAQAGVSLGNAVQNNGQTIYQAIIPVGAKLVDSKEISGAVRGFYRNAEGIRGHANLVEVKNTANVVSNAASSAMNIASMVVGQYYMSQISNQLEGITQKISRITDFQNNEFMSKVFALVSQIKNMSEFQVEIMDNRELRIYDLAKLDTLEHECIELLGQTNKTITDFTSNKTETYEEYQNTFVEIQKWTIYQKILLEVLYRIAELKFALHLGTASIQYCSSLLNTYSEQTEKACSLLSSWHKNHIKMYDINLESSNRKRDGIDRVIHKIPAIFNEEYGYKPISKDIVGTIEEQMKGLKKPEVSIESKLCENDVKMIVKDGKVYYLPEIE